MKTHLVFGLLLTAMLMAPACVDQGPESADHSGIRAPHARWQAYGLVNYTMMQQRHSFFVPDGPCKVYVEHNAIVDVIRESDNRSIFLDAPQRYRTVEELFALIASLGGDTLSTVKVEYDSLFGYPKILSVQPAQSQIADAGWSYATSDVTVLLR